MHTWTPRRLRGAALSRRVTRVAVVAAMALGGLEALGSSPASAVSSQLTWSTVANSATLVPGSTQAFNSFGQPSVNTSGTVVFRGRSAGSQQSLRGVYEGSASGPGSVTTVAQTGNAVPDPNNSGGTFTEFPSFPRISQTGATVVTRGQSTPVWTYSVDGSDTKLGTSGIYATPGGTLATGASLLGVVPGDEVYAVPGAPANTRFDQFPGAPAVDGNTIVFKGNYTVGTTSATGDFYRDLSSPTQPTELIANTSTVIPGQPGDGTVPFGATAPPSAANGEVVFTGWDNEDAPTIGGVYMAPESPSPVITPLVSIGDQVPGQAAGETFTNFGENLSFDGRYVAFWGSWGTATRTITLACVTDGNTDLLNYCNTTYPNGFTTTVPVNQGVFVYDTQTSTLYPIAATDSRFADFLFWTFSGSPPGVGGTTDATKEPPHWRSAAFVAVSGDPSGGFQVAYKGAATDGDSAIYLSQGPSDPRTIVVVKTSDLATAIDSAAPAGAAVTTVSLEREGFRGRWLSVSASMLDPVTAESWAGVYATSVPTTLAPESQTLTSGPLPSAYVSDTYDLAVTSSSDLPVTYTLDPATTNGSCTLEGSTLTFLAVGTCVVDADQAGDASYTAAPTLTITLDVTLHPQTVTPPSISTAYYGETLTLSATSDSGLPVAYALGEGTGEGVCVLDGAKVSFTGLGTCVIEFTQAGNDVYAPADPVDLIINVILTPPAGGGGGGGGGPQSQVITVVPPSTPPSVGGTVELSATASSGLPVAYAVDPASSGVCTLSGTTLSFTSVGTCVVDLSQPGDGLYAAAPVVQQSFSVAGLAARVTLRLAPARPHYGQRTVASAVVSVAGTTPAGSVQFWVDGYALGHAVTVTGARATSAPLRNATAALLGPGRHVVRATYTPADPTRYASAKATAAVQVVRATTRLRLVLGPSTVRVVVASAGPAAATPAGRVRLMIGGRVVGLLTLKGGVATMGVAVPGGVRVQATYLGDGRYAGAVAVAIRH